MNDKTAEADSVSDLAGGPAHEIQITEAMIEAGGEILERALYGDPQMSNGLAVALSEEVLRAAVRAPCGESH
jgi:hypothetical protein